MPGYWNNPVNNVWCESVGENLFVPPALRFPETEAVSAENEPLPSNVFFHISSESSWFSPLSIGSIPKNLQVFKKDWIFFFLSLLKCEAIHQIFCQNRPDSVEEEAQG